jgi:hypothetical protein
LRFHVQVAYRVLQLTVFVIPPAKAI